MKMFWTQRYLSPITLSCMRLDRNRHGGGPAGLELITVSLSRINFKLCISVFYRPPSSSAVIFDLLCDSLSQYVYQSHFSDFVIVGDFNIDFTTNTYPL